MACERRQRQIMQRPIDEIQRRCQRLGERFESRLALHQGFGVADKLKTRVHRVTQHVGDVVEIQSSQVTRAVLHSERAESPGQWIVAILFEIEIDRLEARPFREKLPPTDAVRQGRVAPL